MMVRGQDKYDSFSAPYGSCNDKARLRKKHSENIHITKPTISNWGRLGKSKLLEQAERKSNAKVACKPHMAPISPTIYTVLHANDDL